MAMEAAILATIRQYDMFQSGDNVIVALSGGADSVALFHFMLRHRDALGVSLAAAHFEHGMRGQTSLRDAAFVADLCERMGVKLYTAHGNMQTETRPAGQSEEEWARRLRYAFLESLAGQLDAKVATAHNLGDNAETILFHAIRGAGPRGLSGIPPKRGPFVRPLLAVPRGEIEAYCKVNRLAYMADETNTDTRYARNRLRLNVLPELEAIHPGAAKALARQGEDMRALDAWLECLAHSLLSGALRPRQDPPAGPEGWCTVGKSYAFDAAALAGAAPPVQLKAMALLGGPSASRESLGQMQGVLQGLQRAAGLRGGRRCEKRKNDLWVGPAPVDLSHNVEIPFSEGEFLLPGGYCFRVEFCDIVAFRAQFTGYAQKSHEKDLNFAADCDKISKNSVFRTRRPGDRFHFTRRGVSKSLKKWMNEAGLPPEKRAQLPLLAHGGEVAWLYGEGFAGRFGVGAGTSHVVLIREIEECNDNGD